MHKPAFGPITVVWLLLIVATGMSWALGTEHFPAQVALPTLMVGVLVVSMIKVRFVIIYFMEVRAAPFVLRALFEAWVALVGAGLIGMYLLC